MGDRRALLRVGVTAVTLALSACASAGGRGGDRATEEEWRALALPRPTPLPGAARLSVTAVELAGDVGWAPGGVAISAELGIEELVVAGLLRRPDVRFVERRRFTAAAEAERAGLPHPDGAPAAGVSPGAEYLAAATWVGLGDARSTVEIRLVEATSGSVAGSARVVLGGRPAPLSIARAVVDGVLEALDGLGRRPAWEDPAAGAGGRTDNDVAPEALRSFLGGVVAESTWDWESARRHYQAAAADAGFYEARAALARTARLKRGGTLGES